MIFWFQEIFVEKLILQEYYLEKAMAKITTYLYHDVTNDPTDSGFQGAGAAVYTHAVEHFISDIDGILQAKRSSVVIGTPKMSGEIPDTPEALLFTLDDGGISAMRIADILESKGIFAYFFVTTSKLGDPLFLSEENMRDLVSRGHVVGTHSHYHYSPFRRLDYKDKVYEWEHSRKILEDILSQPVVTGSIPGGGMDTATFQAAAEAGLKLLFTSQPTRNVFRYGELTILGRVCPKNSTKKQFLCKVAKAKSLWPITLMWNGKSHIQRGLECLRQTHAKKQL